MYQGFFINLDRSPQRRAALETHLTALGLGTRYRRFPGVDGKTVAAPPGTRLAPGAFGCWLSHTGLLEGNRGTHTHLHVLEDDVVLAGQAAALFEPLIRQADSRLGAWDLLFTDVYVPLTPAVHRLFLSRLGDFDRGRGPSFVDLTGVEFAGFTSYFVNRQAVAKVCDLLAGGWATGAPIDVFVRDLVGRGRLQAYVTIPFLSTLSPIGSQSDIRGPVDRSRRVCEAYRRGFFIDADLPSLAAEMEKLASGAQVHALTDLFLAAQRFSLSDQWRVF